MYAPQMLDRPDPEPHVAAGTALPFAQGCAAVRLGQPLSQAVDRFQDDAALRLLPVVDAADRPVGAIYERDMRRILFNPFGHALLRNPSFGGRLDEHVRPCAMVEQSASIERLIDLAARQTGRDPVELRRRNLIGAFPYRTAMGMTPASLNFLTAASSLAQSVGSSRPFCSNRSLLTKRPSQKARTGMAYTTPSASAMFTFSGSFRSG